MPQSTAGLSTTSQSISPILSSRDALSCHAQEDSSTTNSPVSSCSRDVSVDIPMHPTDMDESIPSAAGSLLLHPGSQSRRTLRKRNPGIDRSSLRFRPIPASTSGSRSRSNIRDASAEHVTRQRQSGSQAARGAQSERDVRVRQLKNRALSIPSTGKTPATVRQRMVMQMVYDEITPYPDEAWVSQLGIIINR